MAQNQALPAPNLPLLGNNGQMNPIWYQFFNSLWQRTGGGSNSGNVQSITVASNDGIVGSVTNPTGIANITLSLDNITPQSVDAVGQVQAATGYFLQGLSNFGQMQFGSVTNGALTQSGFISIIDINGNVVNLLTG